MTWTMSTSAHCKCLTLVMNPTHDYKLTRQAQSVQWTSFQHAASDDLWNSMVACAAFGNTGAWDAFAQRSQSLLWNSVPITSAACDRYKISVRLTQQCRREVLPGPSLQYWLSMLWDSGVHFNWTKVVHFFFFFPCSIGCLETWMLTVQYHLLRCRHYKHAWINVFVVLIPCSLVALC